MDESPLAEIVGFDDGVVGRATLPLDFRMAAIVRFIPDGGLPTIRSGLSTVVTAAFIEVGLGSESRSI